MRLQRKRAMDAVSARVGAFFTSSFARLYRCAPLWDSRWMGDPNRMRVSRSGFGWGVPSLVCGLVLLSSAFFVSPPSAAQQLAYSTELVWEASEVARAELESWAEQAFLPEREPAASLRHLRRRITRDGEFFRESMRSLGYYGGRIFHEIDQSIEPLVLRYTLIPGEAYLLGAIGISPGEGLPDDLPAPTAADAGLSAGEAARAASLGAAEDRVIGWYRMRGFPFAEVADLEILVDHAREEVDVTMAVAPGPFAYFGEVSVEGLEDVRERVVLEELAWQEGAPFTSQGISETQSALYRRNLFSLVRVNPAETLAPDGSLPVSISVVERPHRTIAAGLEFESEYGPGVSFRWENRNFQHLGRTLRFNLNLSARDSKFETTYHVPHYLRREQDLTYTFIAGQEDTDAYERIGAEAEIFVNRQIEEGLKVGAGIGLRYSVIDSDEQDEDFLLASLPLRAELDRSNDRLNPTEGYRIQAEVTPYLNLTEIASPFLKSDVTVSGYWPLNDSASWVFAARARVGSIFGASRGSIPKDLLFFAGGGGSVRGYGYQSAGPLNRDDEPLGGRSVLEGSLELRRRFNEDFGGVIFFDAGTVYDSEYPDFSETLRLGAGIGLRYFTPLGPLRLDVATPLNKRDSDEIVQFYISIGQAF